MPDFMSWSGPGRRFENIDPNKQPPSRLMHAVIQLSQCHCFESEDTSARLDPSFDGSMAVCGKSLSVRSSKASMPKTYPSERPHTIKEDMRHFQGLPLQLPPSVLFINAGVYRTVSKRVLEFPQINPMFSGRESRYVFGASALHPFNNRPQQAIGVYDCLTGQCDIWSRGWRYYVGEPEVVPSLPQHRRKNIPEELDGVYFTLCVLSKSHNLCNTSRC